MKLKLLAKNRSPLYEVVDRNAPFTYKLPFIVDVAADALVVLAVNTPVFEILNNVDALLLLETVEEATENKVVLVLPLSFCMDRLAEGEVVPIPTFPPKKFFTVGLV